MKKLIVIILISATILNIVAGAFIFLDIQIMNVPETNLTIELINITADEAILQTTLRINNQNPFSIYLQNLTMVTVTDGGDVINSLSIEGGETKAHENKTFTATASIRFNGSLPEQLTSRITGTFGTMFIGIIKKTFPLKFSMITSLNNIITQFALPQVHLAANFSEITQEGINFTGTIEITNPNTIDIALENFSANIETETGIPVGTVIIQGKMIPAKTTQQLTGSGWLLLKALDAKTLQMTFKGDIIIFVAGIRKSMNLSVNADLVPPRLERLLSDLPTEASLTGNYRYTLKGGLHDQITFKIKNPNKITLLATDITVKIYRVDGNKTRQISNGTLPDGIIAQQNTTVLQGDMVIPLTKLWPRLGERFIPDQLQVVLRANITIQGFNQTIWIGVIGYQEFLLHRFSG
jgi:LEA14-like dessication related protein